MIQKQLNDYFAARRQEMVEDICRLVRIDSVKGAPQPGMPFGPAPPPPWRRRWPWPGIWASP